MKMTNAAQSGTRSTTSPLAADAVAGVSDPRLRAVIADHWEHTMKWSPTWATTLGDHRYDDRLAPRDAASIAAMDAEHAGLLARTSAIEHAASSTSGWSTRAAVTCSASSAT
jgi:hypothetical protein